MTTVQLCGDVGGAPHEGEPTQSLHSWDLSSGVDGPGTRLVLFAAGCPLRCLYCQNPDTWTARNGKRVTLADVMAKVHRYRRVFQMTGGGVTFSGGEPMLNHRFTAAALRACHEVGVHTALDTSGALGDRFSDDDLAALDLCLLDIKSFDPATYRRATGGDVEPTLRFARRLADLGRSMWIRFVLVPGLTDDPDNVEGLADFVASLGPAVERVDVLAFHRLGEPKYEALGLRFPLKDTPGPSLELLADVRGRFAARGLVVT